jgi:predicted nucleic acid-binding protein
LSETIFLLRHSPIAKITIFEFLGKGGLTIKFTLSENIPEIKNLLNRYNDISLADACIVRMSEIHEKHMVLTIDSDFQIYRKNKRESIKLIFPPKK